VLRGWHTMSQFMLHVPSRQRHKVELLCMAVHLMGALHTGVVATQQGGAPDGTSSGSGSGAPTAAAPAQKSGEDPAEEAKKRAAEARKWIEAWRSK
jgi:hypothetical protein